MIRDNKHPMILAGAMALLACTTVMAGAAHAKSSNSGSKSKLDLSSTGLDDDARGQAKVKVRGSSDGRFEIKATKLAGNEVFEIVVNDIRVGDLTSDSRGKARASFRSNPRPGKDDFLGFDPRGATVILRDGGGLDLLAGVIPSGSSSGSGDDNDIACCLPDDSGVECEDRTADECLAEGGTNTGVASCLPNPCAGVVPPGGADIVCCLPDDSGPECEDRTIEECAIGGGVVVEADSCLENPCAAMPSADPDTRCCLPDDSGPECEDRTPAECLAQGGVNIGAGVCSIDACVGVVGGGGSGTPAVRVTCEQRSDRSKVSVDGSGLPDGDYSARILAGANDASAPAQAAVLGQAEFDFDSDGTDIAAGATPIAADFLAGASPQVLGQLLNAGGTVIAEELVACDVR